MSLRFSVVNTTCCWQSLCEEFDRWMNPTFGHLFGCAATYLSRKGSSRQEAIDIASTRLFVCVKGAHTTRIGEVGFLWLCLSCLGLLGFHFAFATRFSTFGSWLAKVRTANKVGSSGLLDFHMVAELVFLGRLLCVR